jgi:hypothetical protein
VIGEQAYKGLWWLPGDESDKHSGTLTVTKGEASLELLGHFGHEILYETETERVGSGSLAEQPRILGLTSNGKRVTLEGHVSAPYAEHSPGIPVSTYTRRGWNTSASSRSRRSIASSSDGLSEMRSRTPRDPHRPPNEGGRITPRAMHCAT